MKLSKSCVGPAEKNAACRVLDSEFLEWVVRFRILRANSRST